MLTLFLLGDLRLERNGTVLLAGRRKPLALLAFLARRGARNSSREELASLLWGSGEDANARKSLRQSLSDLRAVDGLSFNETDAGISIAPGTLSTDIDFLDADLRSAAWVQAIGRWHGDFLASAETLGGADWQHWVDAERIAQRGKLALACDQATTAAERAGEWRRSLELASRWRTLLPDDGRAWVREITALQSIGQISDAVVRVAEAEQHFRELGSGIPDDLVRLSRVLSRVRDVAGTPAASLLTPDLVGRSGPLEALLRARVGTRLGDGRSVLVMAPEGLGKTRLVREFARMSRESDREALIVEVSANPSDRLRPLSFLQGIVGALAPQDTLAACAPETLAALAEVAPAIRAHFRHLPSSGSGDLNAAFRSALEEVAREKPVLLILDDLPDADDRSQSVMASILLAPVTGVLVVATGRPESWYLSASLADVPGRLNNRGEQYSLDPLTVDEVRKLLASMAPLAPAAITTLTTSLHEQSGGNPGLLTSTMAHLVISTVLTADHTGTWSLGAADPTSAGVPPSVEARWRARFREMSADARNVVDALAVLCSAPANAESELHQLEQLTTLDGARFKEALEYLRLSGMLRIAGPRVSFSAELFRRLASSQQVPSARNALHGRAARILGRVGTPVAREAASFHRRRSGQVGLNWKVAAALIIATTLSVATWFGTRWSAARVPPRTPVLLADVVNLTGDSVFDQTLYYAAAVGLQQSRQVSLFPRSRVRETLALMQRPGADSLLDESLAREIAVRENLRSVVVLSVAQVDRNYRVAGRIIDPSSGDDLYAHQERVREREDVLDALDRVLAKLRRAAGESRDSIQASPSLPRVTTASLPALKAYATALRAFTNRRYPDARAAYNRAVELDSSFALAWLGLADLNWFITNDRDAAFAALQRAERHSDRLTERERLRLAQTSAGYRARASDELRIAETIANSYPEVTTWYNLGTQQMRRRQCPEALASYGKALGFDSSYVAAHLNIATCHQFLGASEAAVVAYNRAWVVDSLSVYQGALNHEFGVALVRAGRPDSALAVYRRMARRPGNVDQQYGHRSLAYLASWTGQWRKADAHFDSAAMLAGANNVLSIFRNRILQSEVLLTAQQQARARKSLDSAWSIHNKMALAPPFAMYAGLAYVRAGQLDRAAAMLRIINAGVREGSSDDRTVRAVLAARIALAQRRAEQARRELESATDTTRNGYVLPALVDVLVALGHRDSALVAATQLEGRAVFGTDAQDAWLRNLLTMGRMAEHLGQTSAATVAFTTLKSQLQAGDADHPLLIESKRAVARLALTDSRRTP